MPIAGGTVRPRLGETVIAIVALKLGMQLSQEKEQAVAGERLARYKIRRVLHLTGALPRSGAGKTLTHQLRGQFTEK